MEYSALYGQYHMEKTIGCGGFAKVKMATHVLTGEKVAVKIMQKQSLMEDLPRVKHEINALKSLSHKNICKLYQIIETNTHYFLIMEYCSGGELFDHIVEKEKLTEDEARIFFQQIVSAVSYLHSQGFAHRDLKPENILLDKKHSLKLIDFGLSVKPENGLEACLYTSCGSPNYAAPELIKGEKYLGREIDIWSLGVLLYALLCGCLPFEDQSIQKLYEKILLGYYEEKIWLSSESKALLHSLLQVNARKRISTEKLKLHPWFKKGFEKCDIHSSLPKFNYDDDILKLTSHQFGLSPSDLWNDIKKEKYDYIMATYLLLLDKKKNNEPLIMLNPSTSPNKKILISCMRQNLEESEFTQSYADKNCPVGRSETFVLKRERDSIRRSSRYNENHLPDTNTNRAVNRTETFVLKKDRDGIRRSSRYDENCLSGRKNCKRIRSPGLRERSGPEAKRMKENKTPVSKKHELQHDATPCSAKKILVGLEKGFSKAKAALTPRRKNCTSETIQPIVLWGKDLCNVSSTMSVSPSEILVQLQNALIAKGIACTQKGYTIKGKLKQQSDMKKGGANQKQRDKLSFELEVCWIPSPTMTRAKNLQRTSDPLRGAVVGIRRKRLMGDAWIYKNICEEVLALAAPLKKKVNI